MPFLLFLRPTSFPAVCQRGLCIEVPPVAGVSVLSTRQQSSCLDLPGPIWEPSQGCQIQVCQRQPVLCMANNNTEITLVLINVMKPSQKKNSNLLSLLTWLLRKTKGCLISVFQKPSRQAAGACPMCSNTGAENIK